MKYCRIFTMYPLEGALRRELYPKHMEAFDAGREHRIVVFMAANRIGKTEGFSLYEATLHALGIYPSWWTGFRFSKPVQILVSGHSTSSGSIILQRKLLGKNHDMGTGLIPRKYIDFEGMTSPTKDDTIIDYIPVNGRFGKSSFRIISYSSGRRAFEGFEADVFVPDEEPPIDIWSEGMIRLGTTGGIIRASFTPKNGLTEIIRQICHGTDYTPGEKSEDVFIQNCTWYEDRPPHLTDEDIRFLKAETPAYLLDAASKGIPTYNDGAVYPYDFDSDKSTIVIKPFPIPKEWPRFFALDFGWEDPTAILWAAIDPNTGTRYYYAEHYVSRQVPSYHANAIKLANKAAGSIIPGVCDPAGGGKGQHDGQRARDIYRTECDIEMESADNSVEPGILVVNMGFQAGQIKIFNTLTHFLGEIRMFTREKKANGQYGFIGKRHLCDCIRYGENSGVAIASVVERHSESVDAWEEARANAIAEDANSWSPDSWYQGRR
jgi:phage terminase large subunit-like protein